MIDKRMMYAQGQRVRFRGGGMDMGNESNQAQSASMGNSSSNNSSNDNSNDNSNDGPRGPQELGTSTRTVDRITAPESYEIIGGEKFDVTPDTRDDRKRARVKQSILDAPIPNITDKGTSFFKDGNLLNSFLPGDNPLSKPKFSMGNLLLNAGMFALNPVLYAKYNKAKSIYKGAKFAKDIIQPYTEKNLNKPFEIIEGLTENIGLKDKNVIKSFKDSFTNNLTSKTKTKPVINTNTDNDSNDGIASLENANVLQDEYSILLQKLQTGNISDAERTRYTMLKNMLGI
jgi:hypothetical protein